MPIDFVKEANFVSTPTHQISGSVGNDIFSTKKYSLSHGCVCVILISFNVHNYEIEVGDRIGQLTLVKYDKAVFKEV